MVEAVGAVVGAATPGEKVLDLAPRRDGVPLVDQRPVRERQAVEVRHVGPDRVVDDARVPPVTVAAEGPIVDAEHRLGAAISQGAHQLDHRLFALAAADAVHPLLFDHLGEEGGVGTAEHGKDAVHLALDLAVQVQVVALRAGDHRIGRHVGLELAGHLHRVLVGSHNQVHLVARRLERAGQVHDALGLVIGLLGDKENSHDRTHPCLLDRNSQTQTNTDVTELDDKRSVLIRVPRRI